MSQQSPTLTQQYHQALSQEGKSPHTVRAYSRDLATFSRWWEQTTGRSFNPQAVVSTDVVEYRSYLIQRVAPATVNRRLNALKHFFVWARRQQLTTDSPFETLSQVYVKQPQKTAPHWLDRKEQLALLRAVKAAKHPRDLAIVQTLLGTGVRISELAALTVADLEISDRKGTLRVRAGKGMKARQLPLDNQSRQRLSAYLKKRKEDGSGRLFLGQRGPLYL